MNKGCGSWSVKTRVTDPEIPFSMVIVDCYGETRTVGGYIANGSTYNICSMERPVPTSPILIQSITQDGWCTEPEGEYFSFYIDATGDEAVWVADNVKRVWIYSSNSSGGGVTKQLYSNANPSSIVGAANKVYVIDDDSNISNTSYTVGVEAKSPSRRMFLYLLPGDGFIDYIFDGSDYDIEFKTSNKSDFIPTHQMRLKTEYSTN